MDFQTKIKHHQHLLVLINMVCHIKRRCIISFIVNCSATDYIFPDATLVFTYVTTISTVLFVVVWALIIIAYINYSRKIQNFIRKQHINYQAVNTWDTLFLFSLFLYLPCYLLMLIQERLLHAYLVYFIGFNVLKIQKANKEAR